MEIRKSMGVMLFLNCALNCAAWSQEGQPLITDRPDFTESPQTVPVGLTQIEAGVTVERSGNARRTTFGETLVRVGAGNRAEVRIGVPSYIVARDGSRAAGFDDAFLGGKFVLSSHAAHPMALLVGMTLPTGTRRVAPREFQPEAVFATEFDLSKEVGLAINLGVGRPNEGNGAFSQFFGSASFGFEVSERVGAFAELYAFDRTERGGGSQKFVNGGFTYAMKPDLQLDARVGLGLNNKVGGPDYFYGAGVSQRF